MNFRAMTSDQPNSKRGEVIRESMVGRAAKPVASRNRLAGRVRPASGDGRGIWMFTTIFTVPVVGSSDCGRRCPETKDQREGDGHARAPDFVGRSDEVRPGRRAAAAGDRRRAGAGSHLRGQIPTRIFRSKNGGHDEAAHSRHGTGRSDDRLSRGTDTSWAIPNSHGASGAVTAISRGLLAGHNHGASLDPIRDTRTGHRVAAASVLGRPRPTYGPSATIPGHDRSR